MAAYITHSVRAQVPLTPYTRSLRARSRKNATDLDAFLARVYASMVDVRQRASRIITEPATAFAVGALVVDVAIPLLPLNDGSSLLSLTALGEGVPLRVRLASLLTLSAKAVAILIGLVLLRRGRASMASGVFVGVLVVLGLSVISSVLTSIDGWLWQTAVVLGLQTVECVLLFLAVRAARQHTTGASQ
jgi:lysylphosphatidylglycerol synthetase-like protein (DUF2156 family)